MSWQMAMMGAQVGVNLLSAISGASRGAANITAGANMQIAGAKISAAQGRAAAAETGYEIAGTNMATNDAEYRRRLQMQKLFNANAIDVIARGGVSVGGDSASTIADENKRIGEEDVSTIKLMGESRVNQLSFKQTQQNLWAQTQDLKAIGIGDLETRQLNDLEADTTFKILGQLVGAGVGAVAGNSGGSSTANPTATDLYGSPSSQAGSLTYGGPR